jgi:hypothetical protein
MRTILSLVLVTLAGASILESGGGMPQTSARPGPGQALVRITAQQLTEAPPSYAFLVTNLAGAPITSIVIGRQDRTFTIMGVAPNVPARMESPPGWVGRHVNVEERPQLVYHWETADASKRIVPQQSATGFRITLPEPRKDTAQVTFDRVPFEVALAGGLTAAGVVGLDRIPK